MRFTAKQSLRARVERLPAMTAESGGTALIAGT
jgi:hypothetical protein